VTNDNDTISESQNISLPSDNCLLYHNRWILIAMFVIFLLVTFPPIFGYIFTRVRKESGSAAILVLGGGFGSRERHALSLFLDLEKNGRAALPGWARQKPVTIWISTGRPEPEITNLAKAKNIERSRIHLDNSAVDTVTNFSTMSPKMYKAGVSRVYVVTNDFHMSRSLVIAKVILSAYGIEAIPAPLVEPGLPSGEFILRSYRDYLRSVSWFYTGLTGSRFVIILNLARKWRLI